MGPAYRENLPQYNLFNSSKCVERGEAYYWIFYFNRNFIGAHDFVFPFGFVV
jgi:hypothetical protein